MSWCNGGEELILAADHPDRVSRLVLIAPDLLVTADPADAEGPYSFDDEPVTLDGWAKWNRHYWLDDWGGFLEFFFAQTFTERHSTKQIEDAIGWGLETDPQTIVRGMDADWTNDREQALRLCARVPCPTLVIQGSGDAVVGPARGAVVADAILEAQLITVVGSGHAPHLRDPVHLNLLIRDFACPPPPPRRWRRARARGKRALYISSPIGLGHARRDLAIADELRRLHPDLAIDWLAQHPVTAVLEARGEQIHPASAQLANESRHIESESAEHELHCFQAIRRMDEIFVSNFMVFHDVIREDPYDVWIGDEAWELDHHLHENPELKTAAFVWLTDFVGWLPMPDGGERERFLTADYNAEMIEHIAHCPRVRDRAIFVGDPVDIVSDSFGPDLPPIRPWTEEHFSFSGYITGFDPISLAERDAVREELGYRRDELVCIVTVGGSGVGGQLLRRVIASFRAGQTARARAADDCRRGPPDRSGDAARNGRARDPGIRPRPLPPPRRLRPRDRAGGLTTAMELTASRRPFIYFPLKLHFEQNFHVRHRLERYRAGRRMEFDDSPPDAIAAAIAQEIRREVDYRPVATDGAARAASLIAELW